MSSRSLESHQAAQIPEIKSWILNESSSDRFGGFKKFASSNRVGIWHSRATTESRPYSPFSSSTHQSGERYLIRTESVLSYRLATSHKFFP